jgi:predicted flap endonuclease-1-like 5' DNA nuclease
MNWISLLIGILVGWFAEWVLDYLFWRRRARLAAEDGAAARQSSLAGEAQLSDLRLRLAKQEQQGQQLADCEAQLRAKEGELQGLAQRLATAEEDAAAMHQSSLAGEAQLSDLRSRLAQQGQQGQRLADCEAQLRAKEDELQRLSERLAKGEGEVASAGERFATAQVETPPPVPSAAPAAAQSPDDLTVIEGIGPQIAQLLQRRGIATFRQLSESDLGRLQSILTEAGPRFRVANPASWPEQARLAGRGDWDGLKSLQDKLTGGLYQPS